MNIETHINDTPENLRRNIHSAVNRLLPEFKAKDMHDGLMVIVGSGPSVADYTDKIRNHRESGHLISCVNGAHDWLIENNILPDMLVLCDSNPIIASLFTPRSGIEYLVASQCHPSVFDKLRNYDVTIWHSHVDNESLGCELSSIIDKFGPKGWIVYGGGTAALRSINLGYLMGYRKFILYGLDSSYTQGHHHVGKGNTSEAVQIEYMNQYFDSELPLVSQAQDFEELYCVTFKDCRIDAIGNGLLPILCRSINTAKYGRPCVISTT